MKLPAAKFIAIAAHKIGSNPLDALGVPTALQQRQELAALTLQLLNPNVGQEADEDLIEDSQERLDREDAWDAALPGGDGYGGPRGAHQPSVRPSRPPRTTGLVHG